MPRLVLAALAAVALACPALADDPPHVSRLRCRPAHESGSTVCFLHVHGGTLVGADTPVAEAVELHQGIASMQRMAHMPAGTDSGTTSKPHLMLENLTHDLAPHDKFDLTLHFDGAPDQKVQAVVW